MVDPTQLLPCVTDMSPVHFVGRDQIYRCISAVMADIGAVGKDGKNEDQRYKFRGIDQFYNAAHPALVKHGVFCVPQVQTYESSERVSQAGKPSLRVVMKVAHQFYAPDGSSVTVVTMGEGIDSSDKATNKAMSAAMKYAFMELFCVPTEELVDGDKESPEAGVRKIPNAVVTAPKEFVKPKRPTTGPFPPEAFPEFITLGQQQNFAIEFKQSLPLALRKRAEEFRHAWLKDQGFVTSEGAPTSALIPIEKFMSVRTAACAWGAAQL